MLENILTPKNRAWLYGVAGAVVALLVVYGIIAADAAPLWLALVGAVLWALGNLTAIMHTDSVGRAALYGVALAVLALLTYYRVVDDTQATGWGALAAAAFGVGTNVLAFTKVVPGDVVADDYEESLADPDLEDLGDDSEGMAH